MPIQPSRPDCLHWQVFRGSTVVGKSVLSPHQLRSSAWRRLFRDVYADARLPPTHAVNCRGALLLASDGAVVSGRSAAVLHGVPFAAAAGEPVEITVPPGTTFGPVRGIEVRRRALPQGALVAVDGMPATDGAHTAWDICSRLGTVDAVVILDRLLATGAVTPGELGPVLTDRQGARGWRHASIAFGLADGRAQSPPESIVRVYLVQAGLPPPVPRFPVTVGSGLTLYPDLAWPVYRVAMGYDEGSHGCSDRIQAGRHGLDELVSQGWIVLHATRRHLGEHLDHLVRNAQDALRSRGWRAAVGRAAV